MFPCSACFRRAVTVLLGELPLASKSTSTLPPAAAAAAAAAAARTRRQHATIASIRKGHHRRLLRETLASKDPIPLNKKTLRNGPSAVVVRDLRARERNRVTLGIEAPTASADPAAALNPGHYGGGQAKEQQQQYAVQFLKDPLKLASAVLDRLRLGDVQGALGLVRASDRQKVENNVVSWNHVMDYAMSVQDVKGALAVYNEVS
jgi:hypothetical protein